MVDMGLYCSHMPQTPLLVARPIFKGRGYHRTSRMRTFAFRNYIIQVLFFAKSLVYQVQLTLVISTSLISNNCLSRSENLFPAYICSSFPQYFQYISLTSRVQLHIYLSDVVNRIGFFLNSANLICRNTDISKYFRVSLGIRDNKSRLWIKLLL